METENPPQSTALSLEAERFELDQRKMIAWSKSDLVPQAYRNNTANCIVALEVSRQMNMPLLLVMSHTYVIHGKPALDAQFTVALFKKRYVETGLYSPIQYEFSGDGDDYGCVAHTTEKATGIKLVSPRVDRRLVKAMGWLQKSGSMWQTDENQMFVYRSASRLIKTHFPEVLNGIPTEGDVVDITDSVEISPKPSKIDEILKKTHKTPPKTLSDEKDDKVVVPDIETPKKGVYVAGKGILENEGEIQSEISLEQEASE